MTEKKLFVKLIFLNKLYKEQVIDGFYKIKNYYSTICKERAIKYSQNFTILQKLIKLQAQFFKRIQLNYLTIWQRKNE